MSRVKITEYRAKRLLVGDMYPGILIEGDTKKLPKLPRADSFVVKVDQGIKKRFTQGLVALAVKRENILKIIAPWKKKGHTQFLIEPYTEHDKREEMYVSFERVRTGVRVLFAQEGGIDIEIHPEKVEMMIVENKEQLALLAEKIRIPDVFLEHIFTVFQEHHFTFLEINPLVIQDNNVHILDAAVLVDSAAIHFVHDSWSQSDIVESRMSHEREENVRAIAKTSPASLSLKVLNPNGSLFFLLSGGGGSIVIADEAAEKGAAHTIGNYGEYSGGPTRIETRLYTVEVLRLMLASKAQKKALIIAGGIANFTDIQTTFLGVIDALCECEAQIQRQNIQVFVRRGGPHEKEGLISIENYLHKNKLFGSVHGSNDSIVSVVDEALAFIAVKHI